MAVRSDEQDIKESGKFIEIRYDEGFRYLDHCGETLVQIQKRRPGWVPTIVDTSTGVVQNDRLGLVLNFGAKSLLVAESRKFLSERPGTTIETMSAEAEELYNIVVASLNVPNTIRIGARYQFTVLADSIEEADQFLTRAYRSPLLEAVLEQSKSAFRDANITYVVEDEKTGYRRRVTLNTVEIVEAGSADITGLPTDRGKGGIMVDVDTFTRPVEGHFPKAGLFFTNCFHTSQNLAFSLFAWLRDHQKKQPAVRI